MGLDMYLSKKTYISHTSFMGGTVCPHEVRDRPYMNDNENPIEPGDECRAFPDTDPEAFPQLAHVKPERVTYVTEEVGYWRKANAIHQWFVDNVQDGKDECLPHYVGRDNLKELREVCQTVLDNPEQAAELLPPQSGFFFGGTDIDEGYFDDLKQTIELLDKLFAEDEAEMERTGKDYPRGEYEYRSSW